MDLEGPEITVGLYNFKQRFVAPILAGTKCHTIRAVRRYPDKVGNLLHLYTGLRTKRTRLLMRVPCIAFEDILITAGSRGPATVVINGVTLDHGELEALARKDGFADFDEMATYWRGRLPFVGHVIHWKEVTHE